MSLPALVAAVTATVALSGPDASTRDASSGAVRDFRVAVQHHDHKHAGSKGHLQSSVSNVELVSTLALDNPARKKIADVAVWAEHAYLGAWAGPTCRGNGVHVVDLRDPSRPRKVGFIPARAGSYPGEGVQALRLDTASFRGDVLVTNNETCDRQRPLGGLNLYDVSNPRRPRTLVEGFGDRSGPGSTTTATAHEIHSVFAWDAGRKAYAVLVDNRESRNVDIVDISNPRRPVLVAEYDLARRFPQIPQTRPANLVDVFHHDVVVKKVGTRQVMLVSYWDGGYVKLDVTNPRRARYLADSDFATVDPELAAKAKLREPAEGNAHQSELTKDNRYVIAADEDFGPTGLQATADDSGAFAVVSGDRARQLAVGSDLSGDDPLRRSGVRRRPAGPARCGGGVRDRLPRRLPVRPVARAGGGSRLRRCDRRQQRGERRMRAVPDVGPGGHSGVLGLASGGLRALRPVGIRRGGLPCRTERPLSGRRARKRGRRGASPQVLRRVGLCAPLPQRDGETQGARHVRDPGGDGPAVCERPRRPLGPRGRDIARAAGPCLSLVLRGRLPRDPDRAGQDRRSRTIRRRGWKQPLGRAGLPAPRPGTRGGERHRLGLYVFRYTGE